MEDVAPTPLGWLRGACTELRSWTVRGTNRRQRRISHSSPTTVGIGYGMAANAESRAAAQSGAGVVEVMN